MTLYPALVIVLLAQAPQDSVRELIEKFRSGDVVVREEATRKLKELGKAAKVELEKAVKDPDGEVARLATSLVERLTLQETLAPRLQEQIPGLADKLAFGGDPEWTQAFLAVALKCGDSSRLPILTRKE
ncbi:MAG TPA: hypothetical protein VFS19_03740, partial [Planctomycetota bacterium]|nr:hypothetical protein [Planctomycetota bacterium]